MNDNEITEMVASGDPIRLRVSEFIPKIQESIDGGRILDIDMWMSLFQNKMGDLQIPAIIRSVEREGFVYPIGIGTFNDFTQWNEDGGSFPDHPPIALSIGNGHHRFMLGVLASAIRKYKRPGILSIRAVTEFSKPLVVFGKTWPINSTRNEGLYQNHQNTEEDDGLFYTKKVWPNLNIVRDYLNEVVFNTISHNREAWSNKTLTSVP